MAARALSETVRLRPAESGLRGAERRAERRKSTWAAASGSWLLSTSRWVTPSSVAQTPQRARRRGPVRLDDGGRPPAHLQDIRGVKRLVRLARDEGAAARQVGHVVHRAVGPAGDQRVRRQRAQRGGQRGELAVILTLEGEDARVRRTSAAKREKGQQRDADRRPAARRSSDEGAGRGGEQHQCQHRDGIRDVNDPGDRARARPAARSRDRRRKRRAGAGVGLLHCRARRGTRCRPRRSSRGRRGARNGTDLPRRRSTRTTGGRRR